MKNLKYYLVVLCSCLLSLGMMIWVNNYYQEYKIQDALEYDNVLPVLIVGSGVAGLTSSLYIARFGIKSVVCDDIWCIQTHADGADSDGSWPGIPTGNYDSIHKDMKQQSMGFGTIMVNRRVCNIDFKVWPFICRLDNGKEFRALSIILATGCTDNKPNNDLFKNALDLDKDGYVVMQSRSQRCSIKGVFAAGSIHDKHYQNSIVAASDGAKAGIDCKIFLMDIGLRPSIEKQMDDAFVESFMD